MFPGEDNDPRHRELLKGVFDGDVGEVKASLQAGANVDGSPGRTLTPLVAAIMAQDTSMVDFLLGQGADPDMPSQCGVSKEVSPSNFDTIATPGERPLHIAASKGYIGIVRLLLKGPLAGQPHADHKRSRANPNTTDTKGYTPLLASCKNPDVCREELVWLLLEASADPSLAEKSGLTPMHMAALNNHIDVVDMLYSSAPDTLNRWDSSGQTPLFVACYKAHLSMASKLLSLGAMQQKFPHESITCPLAVAASRGAIDVVRVLVNDGGMKAFGGNMALSRALPMAVCCRRARIVRLLLTMDVEEMRPTWANINVEGRRLLHYGAGYCCPAVVSVLLEAGADETALEKEGRLPQDSIGLVFGPFGGAPVVREKEIAIRRMLQRGPAFRARSWAWPSDEDVDAGGNGDGGTATAAAAAAAVLLSPPAVKTAPVVDVRIFRPKEKRSNNNNFVRLIGRYCAKD